MLAFQQILEYRLRNFRLMLQLPDRGDNRFPFTLRPRCRHSITVMLGTKFPKPLGNVEIVLALSGHTIGDFGKHMITAATVFFSCVNFNGLHVGIGQRSGELR